MLTPRQEELLRACVERGYYAIPRRATLRQIAKELDLSTTSLSLALRRAEARLVAASMSWQAASTRSEGVVRGAGEDVNES